MGLFLREKNDGTRAPGYAVYLLGALAATAAVAILHRRASGGADAAAPRRAAQSNVAPITRPASEITRIDVKGGSSRKGAPAYRVKSGEARPAAPAGTEGPSDPFNAIAAALANEGKPAPPATDSAGEPAAPAYPKLAPAFAPGETRPRKDAADSLTLYRDASADTDSAAPIPEAAAAGASASARIPRGSLIRVCLLTTVDTGNPEAVVQFAVARDFIFGHRCQVPFGTRFLGKLASEAARDRLNLSASTIVYPDGTEIPISASAVEAGDDGADIRPGVAAEYLPPPAWAQAAPYLAEAAGGTLGILAARAQPQVAVGWGGINLQAGSGGADVRGPLYQSGAQAIQDFALARLKEFERREAGCHLIAAGSAFWLQLDADLDLSARTRAAKTP